MLRCEYRQYQNLHHCFFAHGASIPSSIAPL